MVLKDRFGRPTLDLRVSVTQRCNLSCLFCHMEGMDSEQTIEMTPDEIIRLVKIAVKLGIRNVKFTGGEPLVRNDILEIVDGIGGIQGIKDFSMTTNGTLLAEYARDLYKSGLMRVNINLPTLSSKVYRELTGGDIHHVLAGVVEAVNTGFYPVKLNMLILRGVNECEIPNMINFASDIGAILQLIELEPINVDQSYYARHHRKLDDFEVKLEEKALSIKTRHCMHGRRVYSLPEARVEVVKPMENTEFCFHCTRLRITSDGKLKPCLMRKDNLVDILTPLRSGASDKELEKIFSEAVGRREPYFKMPL